MRQTRQNQTTVVGNPDTEDADRSFMDVLRQAMSQKRSSDLSLYRSFQTDKAFRREFANLVRFVIENDDQVSNIKFSRDQQ